MKSKLLLALLPIALLSNVSFAKKLDSLEETQPFERVVFADANGTMIGDAQTNVSAESARIYFGFNEKHYYAQLERDWFSGFYLYYDRPGCTGNAYVRKPLVGNRVQPLEALRDGVFYIADSDVRQAVTILSVWEEFYGKSACDDLATSPPIEVFSAAPLVNTNIYTKPYQLKLILAK